jgi:tetratricopeptide (TPR) repeat protein
MDATSGQLLWSENYDRKLDDIFAVQDEITNVIVTTLAGQIEHSELHRTATRTDEDIAAYDNLLRGRQCLHRFTNDGVIEARQYFERALVLQPDYAPAYAGLSISFLNEYEETWSKAPEEALERAYDLAKKAVALDDAHGPARYAIATACYYRGQHELARTHNEKALEMNPNDYLNLCSKGWQLALSGHPYEGIDCSMDAIRRNPLAPDGCMAAIGMAEYLTGQYDKALATFGKMRGWDIIRLACIAACYAQLGRDILARATVAEILTFAPSEPSEDRIMHWSAYWSRFMKFEDPNDEARFLEGLRKAGLPE